MKTYTEYIKEKVEYKSFNDIKNRLDINSTHIYVNGKSLININGIEDFKELTLLDCHYNQIDSLNPLENLIHLKLLDANTNKITSLEPLKNLITLRSLHFHENEIVSLEPLKNLINLKDLYCARNQLQSFKGLPENIKYIWCNHNPLDNWQEDVEAFIRAYKFSFVNSKRWLDEQERFSEIIDLIKINMI